MIDADQALKLYSLNFGVNANLVYLTNYSNLTVKFLFCGCLKELIFYQKRN